MRLVLVIAAAALLVTTTASAAGGKLYTKPSQDLAPTPAEIGYSALGEFAKAKHPTGALSPGYENGVSALYSKGTSKSPDSALATIYIYKTSADATRSWKYTCAKCKVSSAPDGIRFKAVAGTTDNFLSISAVDTCANVYFSISIEGSESAAKLETDDATIASAIYKRALHFGLSSCTVK